MTHIIVDRPPQRPLNAVSTQALCDRHRNLNSAIDGNGDKRLHTNFPPEEAKKIRLLVKVELLMRCDRGDEVAQEYANKRQWPQSTEQQQAEMAAE